MRPGDIVLVGFPQADLQSGKLRPALVHALAPGRYDNVLLALITSHVYQAIPDFDEIIDPTEADFAATGLKTRSVIRLARLASVEQSIINARLGKVPSKRLKSIKKRLVDWLQS